MRLHITSCLFVCLFVSLFGCLFDCLIGCVFVCVFVCLFVVLGFKSHGQCKSDMATFQLSLVTEDLRWSSVHYSRYERTS